MKHFTPMRGIIPVFLACAMASSGATGKIYVDNHGRMRETSTGNEVRYYGVNYTLPFAHAYRAMNKLGVNHKDAIDRDVYHISRMGANAFRLHLWDVELTDSIGNLLDNEHLDLLDYLIESLEKRGIDIILTAQTNFGNGYPERDEPAGGFSYLYDKCEMHSNPDAIEAQKKYLAALANHKNKYTGKTYANDEAIIAMEINNEPCHDTSARQVTSYINAMARTLRKNKWSKPVLYNVSHNMPLAQGYYDADIDGTTFQWYPIGLVSGHRRTGNFLPYVDDYFIPYASMKGYKDKAKVIYEFDPADMLDSYLYPAIARTFAQNGFQWATQFAYDPIDMASYNTEYQTHFLNLAYTPQKAIGMKIASRVMQTTSEGSQTEKYPVDTVFGSATVSYKRNLAMWNTPQEYFYTNNTSDQPVLPDSLLHVAGYGTSPIVEYQGRGAYLIDRVSPRTWRLEVMPDVLYTTDPFSKPSLDREAAITINASHPMMLRLPGLGATFHYISAIDPNATVGRAKDATMPVSPGVYLLSSDSTSLRNIDRTAKFGNIAINEYVAPPAPRTIPLHVNHIPVPVHLIDSDLTITAECFGSQMPDSLVIYPEDISFWRKDNKLYTMHKVAPYRYEATIPASMLEDKKEWKYRIAAFKAERTKTFPDAIPGAPLDWDYPETEYYTTRLLSHDEPVVLMNAADGTQGIEISTIPDQWGRSYIQPSKNMPLAPDALKFVTRPEADTVTTVLSKNIKNITANTFGKRPDLTSKKLKIRTGAVIGAEEMTVSIVNSEGITFGKTIRLSPNDTMEIMISEMSLMPTLLCPAPYPTFLKREFMPPSYDSPLELSEAEKVVIAIPNNDAEIEIIGIWIE